MSHVIIYNPEKGLIELKAQGGLTFSEAQEIVSELAKVIEERHCFLLLNDYREATLNMSTLEIYGLPKLISDKIASIGLSLYKIKRALVIAKESKDFDFLENVTANRGHKTKLFYDVDEAMKWLSAV